MTVAPHRLNAFQIISTKSWNIQDGIIFYWISSAPLFFFVLLDEMKFSYQHYPSGCKTTVQPLPAASPAPAVPQQSPPKCWRCRIFPSVSVKYSVNLQIRKNKKEEQWNYKSIWFSWSWNMHVPPQQFPKDSRIVRPLLDLLPIPISFVDKEKIFKSWLDKPK